MARLFATDSGAVEREIKRLLVVDSGGTTREIQRLFAVDSGGTARLVYQLALLSEDMTIGSDTSFDDWYGFRDIGIAPFGSMQDDYDDGGGTPRNIGVLAYNETQAYLSFQIEGTALNNDTTFREIVVDGNSFLRSAYDYFNIGTNTEWRWNTGTNPIGTSGTIPVLILP